MASPGLEGSLTITTFWRRMPQKTARLHHLVEAGRPPTVGGVLAAGRDPDHRRFGLGIGCRFHLDDLCFLAALDDAAPVAGQRVPASQCAVVLRLSSCKPR